MLRKIPKNPRAWVAAAVATSVVAVVLLYAYVRAAPADAPELSPRKPKYTNRLVALTLSHSILSSQLPLAEILLNAENVTFILPPSLSLDDLRFNIDRVPAAAPDASAASAPDATPDSSPAAASAGLAALIQNYKLLDCLNLLGYFGLVKNLRPDLLLVCSDDLGIAPHIPRDLDQFVGEVVYIDQNRDDIYLKVAPLFFR
jgi:hypothetical protein